MGGVRESKSEPSRPDDEGVGVIAPIYSALVVGTRNSRTDKSK